MEKLFTAYFRRDDHNNGSCSFAVLEDGYYPSNILWEGGIYQLEDIYYEAGEAHYEYYGTPWTHPKLKRRRERGSDCRNEHRVKREEAREAAAILVQAR